MKNKIEMLMIGIIDPSNFIEIATKHRSYGAMLHFLKKELNKQKTLNEKNWKGISHIRTILGEEKFHNIWNGGLA